MTFIPPSTITVSSKTGTVAVEILEDQPKVDYLFVP